MLKEQKSRFFESVAVVGAAGNIGGLFVESFRQRNIHAVIKNTSREFPENVIVLSLAESLRNGAEVVILATPNPAEEVLKEFSEALKKAKKPVTLVLGQNGVGVIPLAQRILAEHSDRVNIIRASLWTTVSRSENGELDYDENRKRVSLAPVTWHDYRYQKREQEALDNIAALFAGGGFDVDNQQDPVSMEMTKLLANRVGATGGAMGLGPKEIFLNSETSSLEMDSIKTGFDVIRKAGIEFADIPWAKGLKTLDKIARLPRLVAHLLRPYIANKIAGERNNQPPAASTQIEKGARRIEAEKFYHQPIIELGEIYGVKTPVDYAMVEIYKRHRLNSDGFSLKNLSLDARRRLFLSAHQAASISVFEKGWEWMGAFAEGLTNFFTTKREVSGKENKTQILETLRSGKSVIINADHGSHADHTTLVLGLKEMLGDEFDNYGFSIVAGMLFAKEKLSKSFDRAYPHHTVSTLKKEDTEDERWLGGIVNGRVKPEIEEFLNKPNILVVYPEGTRSRDGKLGEAVPGAFNYIYHDNVSIVVPVSIEGTEDILPPDPSNGKKWQLPKRAATKVHFGIPIDIVTLKGIVAGVERKKRSNFIANWIMRRIAELLPEEQRGPYA